MVSQKTTPKADTSATAPVDSSEPTNGSGTAKESSSATAAGTSATAPGEAGETTESSTPNGRSESTAGADRAEPAQPATHGQAADEASTSATPASTSDPAPTAGRPASSSDRPAGGPAAETSDKNGAVKAAAVALAAARTAAKKVQSAASAASAGMSTSGSHDSSSTGSSAPPPPPSSTSSGPRPEMHYSAGGVHGTAQQSPTADGSPQTGTQPSVAGPEGLGSPRRVRLSVSRIDPWSIMKLAFLLSVALGIMTVVATAVVWYSLNSIGTFATIQEFLISTLGPQAVDITQIVQFERTLSLATLIALVNVVLFTAIATIMAMLYNITAALVGGVHLTLTDE
ncbi:DUF3566 domain-containing protein [Isoptericola sediminis]|uniref:DUF3566 domain-containing protein n=1 Tax=Isoptericola sediminis TaxID=2733572 RepID=UPI001FE6179E|nr:DUF3566 domain-containing protein [Isoptericola sediminis]